MVHAWSAEGVQGEKGIKDWPVLPADDEVLKSKIAWWNEQLARAIGPEVKIGAIATRELRLSGSWF